MFPGLDLYYADPEELDELNHYLSDVWRTVVPIFSIGNPRRVKCVALTTERAHVLLHSFSSSRKRPTRVSRWVVTIALAAVPY